MTTQINGKDAEWSQDIWQLWHTYVDTADPKLYDERSLPHHANYFTPRPYVDQYNRGDLKAGFTFVVGDSKVYQVITNGQGLPFIVAEPKRPGA